MNNKNVVKKILMKGLMGFPIGVTLLVTSYASLYFISGNDVFNSELYQLHNIKTLLSQTIYVGISGYILTVALCFISHLIISGNAFMKKHPYQYAFTLSLSPFVIFSSLLFPIKKIQVFSENIYILLVTIMMIFIALLCLIFCIKNTIEKHLIKKINQKIKERNTI